MRVLAYVLPLFLVSNCGNSHESPPEKVVEKATAAMLSDRLLSCTLGRALNLDPTRAQTVDEVKYEGRHELSLFLPAIRVRETAPPDPTSPPEPVHPETRIVADPDELTKDVPAGFDRVVDIWPERVELARTISDPLTQLIIITGVDPDAGTANLFMAQATDAATFDLERVYQGKCQIKEGKHARG
jgi:hypothetical protein